MALSVSAISCSRAARSDVPTSLATLFIKSRMARRLSAAAIWKNASGWRPLTIRSYTGCGVLPVVQVVLRVLVSRKLRHDAYINC